MSTPSSISPSFCVAHVTTGCSFGRNCSLLHDIFQCGCGKILRLKKKSSHMCWNSHQTGFQDSQFQDKSRYPRNVNKRKKEKFSRLSQELGDAPAVLENQLSCPHCRRKVDESEYESHLEEHSRQRHLKEMDEELEDAKNDKEGVSVSGRMGVDFGILESAEKAVEVDITIASMASVSLRSSRMRSSRRRDEHGTRFSARLRGKGKVIQGGTSRDLTVIFHPAYAGRYEDTLDLLFFDFDSRITFLISRSVEATVGSREDHELLKPKAPYTRRKTIKLRPVEYIVRSLRPPTWSKTRWVHKLPLFTPDFRLIQAAYGPGISTKQALDNVKARMPTILNETTYGTWFQILLYLEEERLKIDLDSYSMTDVELTSDYPRYRLLVKGLAESRPSVLVGDFILVSHCDESESVDRTWYEGRVQQVYENHVGLRFGDKFSTYKGTKFDVRFVLNRLPFRRIHQALVNKFNPSRILFPKESHIEGIQRVSSEVVNEITPFYRPLGEDEEQMETVAAIINQRPGSVPFVVFGPPGTGKTVTIVEAMKQLLDRDPSVRILACTPNNAAADQIAMKLMMLGKSTVFRLNALSRNLQDMVGDLREFSLINDNQVFVMPSKEQLEKYRVIVSTCLSAGVPACLGLKRGHFSHIFIDEAGQGKEPEVILPIKSIADGKTNIILAGDNQQLGPVVHSTVSRTLGLRLSYLARIMQRDIYDLDKYRGITIVKLVKNFRSHPDILKFSNQHFYKDELLACGNIALINSMENYEELPRKKFPLIFHSIVGKDQREASSPSFFNIDEATQVKKYCLSLINNRKNRIGAENIGVITPYHAQRCKILDLFHKDHKLRRIKVASVEEFQGQERRVIIMSTVRSNKDFVMSDIKQSLGFVANKNRLNVALTRAQALLIVIGNPVVLSLDPLWRAFLNFVYLRGGWKGLAIDWDPNEPLFPDGQLVSERQLQQQGDMEDMIQKLKALIIETQDDGLSLNSDAEEEAGASFERPILREAE